MYYNYNNEDVSCHLTLLARAKPRPHTTMSATAVNRPTCFTNRYKSYHQLNDIRFNKG